MPFGGLLVGGLLSAGGSIVNGLLGKSAAEKAAEQQAASQQKVIDLTKQTIPQANDTIAGGVKDANSTLADYNARNMGLLQPYQITGTNALAQLNGLTTAGGFQAPTGVTYQNDPGYQFRLRQGLKAQDMSAAARGGAMSGGEAKALAQYGQDYASNEYGNVYNRALGTYQTNFGNLQALAGLGLNATNTGVQNNAVTGSQIAGNTYGGAFGQSNNLVQGLGIQANALTGQGNAAAAGTVGGTNALTSGIGGATNSISNLLLLHNILGGGASGGGAGLGPGADLGNLPGGGPVPTIQYPPP
ncbi:MAG: hypothetical protein V4502_08120 [Pseudomonadota bacterium]